MKQLLKPLAAIAATALIAAGAMADGHSNHGIFRHVSTIEFDEIIPGTVAFATVAGDRETGAHGTFVRIPAGKATPQHTHSKEYHAVVIAGILENPITDDPDSNQGLPAGSYYFVPAGAPHVSRCAADSPVDCITYFHQGTAFDFAATD